MARENGKKLLESEGINIGSLSFKHVVERMRTGTSCSWGAASGCLHETFIPFAASTLLQAPHLVPTAHCEHGAADPLTPGYVGLPNPLHPLNFLRHGGEPAASLLPVCACDAVDQGPAPAVPFPASGPWSGLRGGKAPPERAPGLYPAEVQGSRAPQGGGPPPGAWVPDSGGTFPGGGPSRFQAWEKRYTPELKPLLQAFEPWHLLSVTARCLLLSYLPLFEKYLPQEDLGPEEREEDEEEKEEEEEHIQHLKPRGGGAEGGGGRKGGVNKGFDPAEPVDESKGLGDAKEHADTPEDASKEASEKGAVKPEVPVPLSPPSAPADAKPPPGPAPRPFFPGLPLGPLPEWLKPTGQASKMVLREIAVNTVRRIVESYVTTVVEPRIGWKLTKDTVKSAKRKAARGTHGFDLVGQVFVTTIRGHVLGSLASMLLQLKLDLVLTSHSLIRRRAQLGASPGLIRREMMLLARRQLAHIVKCLLALVSASLFAGFGSVVWPGQGSSVGFAIGDMAGAAAVNAFIDPLIVKELK